MSHSATSLIKITYGGYMRKLKWFIITALFLVVYIPLTSTVLFHDDFNRSNGNVGNSWTNIGPATTSIQDGELSIQANGGMGIYRDFTAISSGTVIVQFDWKIISNNWLADTFPLDIIGHIMHDYQGNLFYDLDGLFNNPTQIGTLPFNTWATIRVAINLDDNNFSFWLDGEQLLTNQASNSVNEFDRWTFKAYPGATVDMSVDNFMITDADGTNSALSNIITFDTVNPIVELTSPLGGEEWIANETHPITWNSITESNLLNETSVIAFSSNNGVNYTPLATDVTAFNSWDWYIPSITSEECLVKISVTDSFGNIGSDTSAAPFSLLAGYSYGYSSIFSADTVDPTLELTAPVGGEVWYIGEMKDISWSASDNSFDSTPVDIYYSTSGSFNELEFAYANSGIFSWEVPAVTSENAKIKVVVTDNFGNFAEELSESFVISYVPPATPQDVVINLDNGQDAVVSWSPVTETIYSTPITPDGYIVLYSEVPEEGHEPYYFLGYTPNITYTHQHVTSFREQMYYKVIAYKDFDGRVETYLATLQTSNSKTVEKIPFSELKKVLNYNNKVSRRFYEENIFYYNAVICISPFNSFPTSCNQRNNYPKNRRF